MKKYFAISFVVILVSLLAASAPLASEYDKPIDTTDDNFYNDVIRSYEPVIVEFWAPWCSHCRNMAKTMNELASELSGKVKVVKVNVDKCPDTADKYKIEGIPAFIYFKDGTEVSSAKGEMSKEKLKKKLGI